ncbi:hypothetical protein [Actinosynnema sp. NPDC020468]|uniref:hypothetical protein n=1 Tax=Actinosynnema sp. NPDC020468 TaxID=3154488 RepID=UPI00340FC178
MIPDVQRYECRHDLPEDECTACGPFVPQQGRYQRLPSTPAEPAAVMPGGLPCLVRDGEEWRVGTLVWEKGARADGRWWARVRYRVDGRLITADRHQDDLKPRSGS